MHSYTYDMEQEETVEGRKSWKEEEEEHGMVAREQIWEIYNDILLKCHNETNCSLCQWNIKKLFSI